MSENILPCQRKPKTKEEEREAEEMLEAFKQAEWEQSLEYHLLMRGR